MSSLPTAYHYIVQGAFIAPFPSISCPFIKKKYMPKENNSFERQSKYQNHCQSDRNIGIIRLGI